MTKDTSDSTSVQSKEEPMSDHVAASTKDKRIILRDSLIYWDYEGKKRYIHENVLAQLLLDGQLMLSLRPHTTWKGVERRDEEEQQKTTCVFVLCSDMFAWGSADCEPVTWSEYDDDKDELSQLYEMHMKDTRWGSVKWCILKRKEYPQKPVLRDMIKAGAWDFTEEQLATLKPCFYDAKSRQQYLEKKLGLSEPNEWTPKETDPDKINEFSNEYGELAKLMGTHYGRFEWFRTREDNAFALPFIPKDVELTEKETKERLLTELVRNTEELGGYDLPNIIRIED